MASGKLNKLLDSLDTQSDELFRSTYHSTGVNRKLMAQVSDDLSTSIQTAIKGDSVYADMSNTTKLYEKILSKTGTNTFGTSNIFGDLTGRNPQQGSDFLSMFNDPEVIASLMETYADTRYIKVLDEEIDLCLKHMPKLKKALKIKKENVLCADNFSKSFIIPKLNYSLNPIDDDKFNENANHIMQQYNFEHKCEEWYDNASMYGESMVYCVPYKKAYAELLARKQNTQYAVRESVIMENGTFTPSFKPNVKSSIQPSGYGDGSFVLKLNRTGILDEAVLNIHDAISKLRNNVCGSIYEQFLEEGAKDVSFDKTIGDTLTYDDDERSTANDGLLATNKPANKISQKIKTPGCVLRDLPHDQVIPLYIEDINIGYYYIDIKQKEGLIDGNPSAYMSEGISSVSSMFGSSLTGNKEDQGDQMLKYISGKIAENIDAAFINANQDLRKEIYMMLKYNDKYNRIADTLEMNVTYIPPEDIIHIKFNEDPKTHRGRSDIWDGLIAAKMWIMLNSTTVIGNATRGQDKRVYYVKTMVETNVAKTLLNVVEQIKKGNFGIRQMESVNNILNIVGKFNDFVIPVGPSGDSPVSFDILSGQQFDFPTDAMDRLEDSAIGTTGIPLEVVNSSMNMDFAIRYTMTNGSMLRDAIKRQNYLMGPYSQIFTRLYNCEFDENVSVKITMPEPVYLAVQQGSQLIQNSVQYIDSISDIETQGKDDTYRGLFRKKMFRDQLGAYVDLKAIDRIHAEIAMEIPVDKARNELTGGEESY